MEDRTLIAILTVAGALFGALATVTVGFVSSWASNKQTESEENREFLKMRLSATEMAQQIYQQIHEETEKDFEYVRNELREVKTRLGKAERSNVVFARIVADVVDTEELEEIQTRLNEDSDADDIRLDW